MNETISYEQACAELATNAYTFSAIATALNCEQNPESILDAIANLKSSLRRSQDELSEVQYISKQGIEFSHKGVGYSFPNIGALITDFKRNIDLLQTPCDRGEAKILAMQIKSVESDHAQLLKKYDALEMNHDFTEQHRQELLKEVAIAKKTIKILLDKIPD